MSMTLSKNSSPTLTPADTITEDSETAHTHDNSHIDKSMDSLSPEKLEALEASELEEDLAVMKLRFPDFPSFEPTDYNSHCVDDDQAGAMSSQSREQDRQALDATWNTISWYPGHRRVARLKEKWLKERRPSSYVEVDENRWHGKRDWKAFLEASGYEIRDDDIEEEGLSNKHPQ